VRSKDGDKVVVCFKAGNEDGRQWQHDGV
jgi:hypothetical protein